MGVPNGAKSKKGKRERRRTWTRFDARCNVKTHYITPTCFHCKRVGDAMDWSMQSMFGGGESPIFYYETRARHTWWIDGVYTDRDERFVERELRRYGGWRTGSIDTAFHICPDCRLANSERTQHVSGNDVEECYRCWTRSPTREDKWNTNKGCDPVTVSGCGIVYLCYDCKGFLYYHE